MPDTSLKTLVVSLLLLFTVVPSLALAPPTSHDGQFEHKRLVGRAAKNALRQAAAARAASSVSGNRLPYNVANPAPTPSFVPPPPPQLLSLAELLPFLAATNLDIRPITSALNTLPLTGTVTSGLLNALGLHRREKRLLGQILGGLGSKSSATPTPTKATTTTSAAPMPTYSCLDATTGTEKVINSLFKAGGAGTIVYLCPNSVVPLLAPIQFTSASQSIQTKDFVVGTSDQASRGTLKVMASNQSCAIYAVGDGMNYISLKDIQINGNRPELDWDGGLGLIEMGGNTVGQTVTNIRAYEPRSWTAFHGIEGYNNMCRSLTVKDSEFGPAGNPPDTGNQFRKRAVNPGEWADGISMACGSSIVDNNLLLDTTDGAIVIFGAPGSQITNNRIVARSRQSLGGINLVDYFPWYGSYAGTVVSGNTITTESAFLKIGIAIGTQSWFSYYYYNSAFRNFGATVKDNVLQSTGTGYFGYGITISGMNSTTVTGNTYSGTRYSGTASQACVNPPPAPAPLLKDPNTTSALTTQSDFKDATIVFAICTQPGGNVTTSA